MVLTLDPFATMAPQLRAKIWEEAAHLANEDGNIIEEDRRHVIICPIQELEQVLHTSNEDIFLESLSAASESKYDGWQFREVHRQTKGGKGFGNARPYPFELGDLLPWWRESQRLSGGVA